MIHGVFTGEELEDLFFQPGNWERWQLLFRRAILANTLVILTTNSVAVIQEELEISEGWIISYTPLGNIVAVQNQLYEKLIEIFFLLKQANQTVDYRVLMTHEAVQSWRASRVGQGGQRQDLPAQAA